MQLLAGSALTPAGNDKRIIRFSKPFGADPVVMVSNGDAGLDDHGGVGGAG